MMDQAVDGRMSRWQELNAAAEIATGDEEQDAFQIGMREGFSEAVQLIDLMTGGDGEYRYCLGFEQDERHCPDPDAMIAKIAERFEVSEARLLALHTAMADVMELRRLSVNAEQRAKAQAAIAVWRRVECHLAQEPGAGDGMRQNPPATDPIK